MSDIAVPPDLEDWFRESMIRLVRGDASTFSHFLENHEEPFSVAGTQTSIRTHFLASDGNGNPAVDLFASAIASHITDFCIPRSRLTEAFEHWQRTGSSSASTSLERQARELFVASEKSGEGGELLLFLLMEQVLGLPQLVSKMTFKTSTSMHVHGSDGIHARFGDDGILNLYWGESKLHKSTSSAFSECFESLSPYLISTGSETRKRDLLLIHDNLDASDQKLTAHLIEYFDETKPNALKIRFKGVGLVGFDMKDYPNPLSLSDEDEKRIKNSVARWRIAIEKHIKDYKLDAIGIDIFCIPFPSVESLRKAINTKIGVTK